MEGETLEPVRWSLVRLDMAEEGSDLTVVREMSREERDGVRERSRSREVAVIFCE